MNWKATTGLGAALLVLVAVYFLMGPAEKPPKTIGTPPALQPKDIERIELGRRDEAVMLLERAKDEAGTYWRLAQPIQRPADDAVVNAMARNLVHLRGEGDIKVGTPEADPKITGLDRPRLTLRFHGRGKVLTYLFGNEPRTQQGHLFFMEEGADRIQLIPKSTVALYDKPLAEVRSSKLVRFEQFKAEKVELSERWEKGAPGGRPDVVYEKTVMEKRPVGEAKTWFMVDPRHENVDDLMVNQLVADLNGFPALEFVPGGDEEARKLTDGTYESEIRLHLHGGRPITFRFGGMIRKDRSRLYVKVDATGEVAVVDRKRFEKLLRRRSDFRSKNLFPFTKDQIRTLKVEAKGLGKVVVERQEKPWKKEGVTLVSWKVVEPEGIRVDRERVEPFVDAILVNGIEKFLGEQPDLSLFNLKDPDVVMTVETPDREYGFRFGLTTKDIAAFAMRDGGGEVYGVPMLLVQHLKRLELNFLDAGMFDARYEDIAGFRVEVRDKRVLQRTAYEMAKEGKTWSFVDKAYANERPNMDRVRALLSKMNYIQASGFMTREKAAADHYDLQPGRSPTELRIRVAGKEPRTAVLYISADLDEQPGRPVYIARFEGSDVIFKPDPLFVEGLKRPPILGPDDEPEKPRPPDGGDGKGRRGN